MFSDPTLLWLFLSGIPVGIFAIVFGGSMFLSVPVFQLLFPEFTLGAIIGNIKVGSLIRNTVALHPLRKRVQPLRFLPIIIAIILGGGIGALGIASTSQRFVLPVIILAILLTESAPWLTNHLSRKALPILALLVGVFGGIFGAGLGILILALLRLHIPDDNQIVDVRANAVFVELTNAIATVAVIFFSGQLVFKVWLAWAAGSLIGGYLGGVIIERTGKCSPRLQKLLLRLVFVVAIGIALYKIL